ncbi:extensin [Brachypodium distachyon]|uniref:VQ domain-containing protein n=1 Tax=Brachypodium distachyon TaxID=15368 RepID=I1H4X9_BRADI|nr:extensin [Brachypodium distachyon]KQK21459.1 hypothetical protein BRADI_1g60860v3 [Brachypodium distachyon]|eukprot:XP_003561582.1 extensin [Brachypodium distachyon]
MASTTSDSLPSSPSFPGADQESFSSVFFPSASSSSPAGLYLDHDSSSFHAGFMSSPPPAPAPPAPPSHAPAPPSSKPPKKRPRASRRPPTTVLTTDTSNFRAMVQEFTGFPAPPFAAGPPPSVRPRLLGGGGPPFLLRPSPLKYPQQHNNNPASLLAPATGAGSTSNSLVDALALFARSNAQMPIAAATAGGSGAVDQYGGGMLGGFNPFDDFEAASAAEGGEKAPNGGHGHAGFFSSLGLGGAGDKYDRH